MVAMRTRYFYYYFQYKTVHYPSPQNIIKKENGERFLNVVICNLWRSDGKNILMKSPEALKLCTLGIFFFKKLEQLTHTLLTYMTQYITSGTAWNGTFCRKMDVNELRKVHFPRQIDNNRVFPKSYEWSHFYAL